MNPLHEKASSDMALVGLILGGLLLLGIVAVVSGYLYTFGWSERFLEPVHVGMTNKEVETLVGSPLELRTNNGCVVWSYTRSWSRDANVYFGTNGLVWAVETD